MATGLSRRALLALAGGGGLAVASAALIWKSAATSAPPQPGEAVTPRNYVDHEGWMLTAAEKESVPRDQLATEVRP